MLLGSFFADALCYVDDLTILAPSLDALWKLLQTCETFADSHHICFNGDKTQLICFCLSKFLGCCTHGCVQFCCKQLDLEESVVHLGTHFTCDMDIWAKTVRQSNSVLFWFCLLDPPLKTQILSFIVWAFMVVVCEIWAQGEFSHRKYLLRRIWSLPYNCSLSCLWPAQ